MNERLGEFGRERRGSRSELLHLFHHLPSHPSSIVHSFSFSSHFSSFSFFLFILPYTLSYYLLSFLSMFIIFVFCFSFLFITQIHLLLLVYCFLTLPPFNPGSRGSSVSIVTTLRAERPEFDSRYGQGSLSLRHRIQTSPEAHPAAYPVGTGDFP
jgi:hypothetical protein